MPSSEIRINIESELRYQYRTSEHMGWDESVRDYQHQVNSMLDEYYKNVAKIQRDEPSDMTQFFMRTA